MKRIVALSLLVAASACGGSPSSPNSPLSLSGTWTGRFEYQTAGVNVSDDVTMAVIQSSTTSTGNWSAAGQTTGTVTFTAAPTISGGFTITQTNIASGACTGSSTINGTATATDLVFAVSNVAQTAACPWATGMKFTLHK
jgi:hypothetical protein